MAAGTLSANRDCKRSQGRRRLYTMVASKVVYKGALIGLASGLAQPFVDEASEIFVGVACEPQTSASSGTYTVMVEKTGEFEFNWYDDNDAAAGDVGALVYAASDSEVSPNASGSGATKKVAQNIVAGYVQEIISATKVRVRIDRAVQ